MGRRNGDVHRTPRMGSPGERNPWFDEWALVVGNRVRRLRKERDMSLNDLASRVEAGDGGTYSAGFVSQLERGWPSGPLVVYLRIAREPELGTTGAERALLGALRDAGVEPGKVLGRLLGTGG